MKMYRAQVTLSHWSIAKVPPTVDSQGTGRISQQHLAWDCRETLPVPNNEDTITREGMVRILDIRGPRTIFLNLQIVFSEKTRLFVERGRD